MPYQVQWLAQDRVLFEKIWGIFDDEEAQHSDQEIVELLERSSSPSVHLLIDISEVNAQMSIGAVYQLTVPRHPKFGWLIAYGGRRSFVRALLMLTVAAFNLRYRLVEDHNQALEFLAGLDALPERSIS